MGSQPPGRKNIVAFLRAYFHLLDAYKKSYKIIHDICPKTKVSFAQSTVYFEADIWKPLNELLVSVVNYFSNYFVKKTEGFKDFVTCNYYIRIDISLKKKIRPDNEKTDLGWKICPKGIYSVLKSYKKYNLPIYITENGLADAADNHREKFIKSHLYWVHKAIQEGVDVRGYLHWSLLDNFEAPEVRGFWPRFGLVEVDYKTMKRKIRPSALEYKKICETNTLKL